MATGTGRPLHCTAPDVLPLTDCLSNTNGRCTWCGRPMPKKAREWSREWAASPRRSGTDPIAYLGDAREEEN